MQLADLEEIVVEDGEGCNVASDYKRVKYSLFKKGT